MLLALRMLLFVARALRGLLLIIYHYLITLSAATNWFLNNGISRNWAEPIVFSVVPQPTRKGAIFSNDDNIASVEPETVLLPPLPSIAKEVNHYFIFGWDMERSWLLEYTRLHVKHPIPHRIRKLYTSEAPIGLNHICKKVGWKHLDLTVALPKPTLDPPTFEELDDLPLTTVVAMVWTVSFYY